MRLLSFINCFTGRAAQHVKNHQPNRTVIMTSTTSSTQTRMPCAYINHGGGPLPLLGRQPDVKKGLEKIANSIPKPKAIVVVSAHYETAPVSIMTSANPGMYYDYGGFPPETYHYKYTAPGDPKLAARIGEALNSAGVPNKPDNKRDYDHGMFVPLMIMYPDADIPVVGVSVPSDSKTLWSMGVALQSFRDEGVLVLGSGASFHSFPAFFRSPTDVEAYAKDGERAQAWNKWLVSTVCESKPDERRELLCNWRNARHSSFSHPTPEHFTPLLVVAAAAGNDTPKLVDPSTTSRLPVSQFIFSS